MGFSRTAPESSGALGRRHAVGFRYKLRRSHLRRDPPSMNRRQLRYAATVVICAGLGVGALAQSDFDASYQPPRLPSGKPDLQGVWSNAVLTPLERPADLADKPTMTREEAEVYEAKRNAASDRDTR